MNERRLNGRRRIYLTYQIRLSFGWNVAHAPCGLASSLSHDLERSWSSLGCDPIDKHPSMSTSSYGRALAQVPASDFLVYHAAFVLEPVPLPLHRCTE